MIGHQAAQAWLQRALQTGRVAHAYLITGPRAVLSGATSGAERAWSTIADAAISVTAAIAASMSGRASKRFIGVGSGAGSDSSCSATGDAAANGGRSVTLEWA